MNKKYDFTETGGFPLDQGVCNDLQSGILESEAALAATLGPLVIISGCIISGGSTSNGFVAINGEILPFVGAPVGTQIIIVETDADLTYFDGDILPSYITRYATFGDDGITDIIWADFLRVGTDGLISRIVAVEQYWQVGDIKEIDVTEAYITANFDGTGLGKNLRAGWAICNGNNGTVNRLGRVPVMRDPSQTEFATMALPGGAKEYQIEATDLPELETEDLFLNGAGSTVVYGNATGSARAMRVNQGSPNDPISLLQLYITTLFIQKV